MFLYFLPLFFVYCGTNTEEIYGECHEQLKIIYPSTEPCNQTLKEMHTEQMHDEFESTQLHSRYSELSGKTFQGYFNWFTEELAEANSKHFIKTAKNQFIETNWLETNRYLEMGPGRGYVASALSPYFSNTTIIEPNPLFREATETRLRSMGINNVQYIQRLADDFKADEVVINGNKFNLIIMQHVLWTVSLNKWDCILNELYDSLSDQDSVMVITHTLSEGTYGDIHRHFAPEMRLSDYIEDHFRNSFPKSLIELWQDNIHVVVPETEAILIILDLLKVNVGVYNENMVVTPEEEIITVIRYYLRRDGCYTDDIDKDSGEYMVNFEIPDVHIIVKNL